VGHNNNIFVIGGIDPKKGVEKTVDRLLLMINYLQPFSMPPRSMTRLIYMLLLTLPVSAVAGCHSSTIFGFGLFST